MRRSGVELVRAAGAAGPAAASVAWIPAATGGTIETARGRLTIPPGALRADTSITMHDLAGVNAGVRFGPPGLVFGQPARLAISVDRLGVADADRCRLRIAWGSDDGEDWRVVGGAYEPGTDRVVVGIDRFSQYALCLE